MAHANHLMHPLSRKAQHACQARLFAAFLQSRIDRAAELVPHRRVHSRLQGFTDPWPMRAVNRFGGAAGGLHGRSHEHDREIEADIQLLGEAGLHVRNIGYAP
jgi:hypothetical protein